MVNLPSFRNLHVLCSTCFAFDIWKSCSTRKLWMMWRNWCIKRTTVRRKMKVRKTGSQICVSQWRLFIVTCNDSIQVQWIHTCSVCDQLSAFFACSLCITLSRHHAGLSHQNLLHLCQCCGTNSKISAANVQCLNNEFTNSSDEWAGPWQSLLEAETINITNNQ